MKKTRITFLVELVFLLANSVLVAARLQWKPSKSDADISSIRKRNIAKGPHSYSIPQEEALGKQLSAHLERSIKLVGDPEVTDYIDRLGQMLARNSDAQMPVVFRVVDDDPPRSFTLPGGYQYINRGLLLTVQSDAELAGVLAHGIAETAIRSALKEAMQGYTTQLAAGGSTAFGAGGIPKGNALVVTPDFFRMQREAVLAADYFGLQYVYVTGYDPQCYVEFVERVWPQVALGQKKPPEELSLFPPLPARLAAMRKEIAAILPKRDNAVVATPQFKDFQEHVRAWKPTPQ